MALLSVRVTPRAGRDSVVRDLLGGVHVRVAAAPADGAANEAVRRVLAAALGLPPRDVVLKSGATSRTKRFEIALSESDLAARVQAITANG